ncbi:glutathione S-transferase family protein [Stagnihabitans tardus]|uniref:Glutathione S-transferase family protein n=1 Tax=Stagnihabitans tardus TaxID=2699202 RepID=A0AAE4YGC1_9RHOB|nr:glutathione S-transferase [Stagnihabitans tardus]NBZ89455.1 glutathione S-transferase family protein [Stagnihabitans tardus]
MYTLHYWPDSASQGLRILLRVIGAPFTEILIDRENGALDSPAYRALQPLGKIPALETPDGPVFETAAIFLHLAERHGLAPSATDPQRGAFLSWLFFTSYNLHAPLMSVFYPERVASDGPEVAARAAGLLRANFATLDAMAATPPDWLQGTKPLPIYLAMLVHWLGGFPPGHAAHLTLEDLPHLGPLLAPLELHPAVAEVCRDEGLKLTYLSDPY